MPYSGTSVGLIIFLIWLTKINSGDKPPWQQKIVSSINEKVAERHRRVERNKDSYVKNEEVDRPVVEEPKMEDEIETVDNSAKKEKSRKIIITSLSLLSVGVVLGSAIGYHLSQKKSSSSNSNTTTNKKEVVYHDSTSGANENYLNELNELYSNNETLTRDYYKNVGLEQMLNDINTAAFANSAELYYFLNNGQRMSGDEYVISFQGMFDSNTKEYYVMQELTNDRNNMIANAYNNQNVKATQKEVHTILNKYFAFIFGNRKVANHTYNSLDSLAKYGAVVSFSAMLETVPDYSITLNGKRYEYSEILNKVSEEFDSVCQNLNSKTK